MTAARLLAVNALIRIGAAGSGQAFAFLIADRWRGASTGAWAAGLLGATFFVTELAGAPLAGRMADRIGHLRVLRFAAVPGAISAIVAAGVGALGGIGEWTGVLVFARFAEGASAACAVPASLTLLARHTDSDAALRMRLMGAFEVISLIGMIAGYALVGVVWDRAGPGAFLVIPPLFLLTLTLLPRSAAITPPRPTPRDSAREVIARILRLRGAPAFAVAWLSVNAVVGAWLQYAPLLMRGPSHPVQRLAGGHSGTAIGLIFAAWGATFLLGMVLWTLFAARWSRRRVMLIALSGMLGVVATLWSLNRSDSTVVLLLFGLCVLIESGFTPAAFAHLGDLTQVMDADRGAALGLYSLVLGLGQLIGVGLGGPFVAQWRMDGLLALTALLAVGGLAGVLAMGGPAAQHPRSQTSGGR